MEHTYPASREQQIMRAEDPLSMLHPRLRTVMKSLGYARLLPVQEKSIPHILRGSNVLVVAPTGSGKTEAALFPVMSRMIECRERGGCKEGVLLVYVTPLRALNRDIESRIKSIVEGSGFTVMVRHGDTTPSGRRKFAKEAPSVMITTPESLNLLLTVKQFRRLWENVRWVIVDEVHEFVDSERGSELSVILERLEALSRHRVQRIGLSATISERTMTKYAGPLLAGSRPFEIVVDPSRKDYDIRVVAVRQGDDFWVRAAEEIGRIASSVKGKILVFVNTRSTAERLAAELTRKTRFPVAVHHGSLSRAVREEAEKGFKYGNVKILVATSSMELGIDIGEIELVIQFLSPRSVITMTQRVGRAGHRFGETSRAVIVTSDNVFELLESSVIAFRVVKGVLEDQKLHMNPLDALAHQIAGIVLERDRVSIDGVYKLVSRAAPFRYLSDEDLEDVVLHLDGVRVLRFSDDGVLARGFRIYRYFYKVSMIPDERNYVVYDALTGEKIGELSERFVEARLMQAKDTDRFAFMLAGKMWEALDVDPERGRIEAKLIGEVAAYVPSWEGELIPVDYRVAREICSIISLCMEDEEACRRLLEMRRMNNEQIDRIVEIAVGTRQAWRGIILGPHRLVIEPIRGGVVLYACLGSKGNFALALLISSILRTRYRVDTVFDYIPYAIVLRNPLGLDPNLVARAVRDAMEMDPLARRSLIEAAVRESIAFTIRFIQVAKRMGVVDPDKAVPRELAKKVLSAYRGTVVEREALREIAYDKLDFEAVEAFLGELRSVDIAPPGGSPLLQEVLENPYLRKDKALDLRKLAIDALIESYRRRMKQKRVLLLCASCGHAWERTASAIDRNTSCPKCGSRMIAVLPTSEWGRSIVAKYREFLSKRPRRLRGEMAKAVKEVRDRASLFIEYYRDGLIPAVVEALSAHGVGPARARRVISALVERGRREFYRELFRAMEEYAANRKYWKPSRSGRS